MSPMVQVQGFCEDRFTSVRDLLQANLNNGQELGASLAVEIDGRPVINLWGGYQDEAKVEPWKENTVVNLFSATKSVGSLSVLLLVERGLVDLDGNVCTYWPDFAANGKEHVKVRQIMSHTAGLPGWTGDITLEETYDEISSAVRLASQAPWWEPGTSFGYHAGTHGILVGELVRRVSGKNLRDFITEELARPLDADFRLGIPPEEYSRVATMIPPPPGPPPPIEAGSIADRVSKSPAVNGSDANTKGWRDSIMGSGNGTANGRSIAKILSPIALGGTVDGTKYLSPETIDHIFEVQSHSTDLVFGLPVRFGTGFGLPAKDSLLDWWPAGGRICGWGGMGGSVGLADLDRRMTIGYAMNKMHPVMSGSVCTKAYVAEIYRILGVSI